MSNGKEKRKEVVPFRNDVLCKSNYFIGAKYKASVLENQITYLAMLKIQEHDYQEKGDGFYVTLNATEIREAIGISRSGSFYENLQRVANDMTGNNIGIVDNDRQKFEFITLINKASYDNGQFTIRFALELRNHLIGVERDYTKLNKEITMGLKKKPYSIPLYELLKSQCYYPKGYTGERNYVFSVVVGLSELKLDIGVVNIKDSPDVKRALLAGTGTTADYDRAVERSKDQMYVRWAEFDRKCLKKTVEEINRVSDIYVEYEKKTKGRGSRVYAVDFTVWLKEAEKENWDGTKVSVDDEGNVEVKLTEEEKFQLYYDVLTMFSGYDFGFSDAMAVAAAADLSRESVKKAYEMLKKANGVDDAVAWTIACIKGKYWETEKPKKKMKKNQFNDFPQREYTGEEMSDLEKTLLNRNYNNTTA